MSSAMIGVVLDGRGKEGVDEGRLSEARLSCHLTSLSDTIGLDALGCPRTMIVKAAPRLATILCL